MRCSSPCPRFVLTLTAALALAACQPPPRPFQSLDPLREQPLARPSGPLGLLGRAVSGAPAGREFAEQVAAAFAGRDIAATTGRANLRAWLLTGRAEARAAPGGAGFTDLHVVWQLTDETGGARGSFEQRARLEATTWQRGTPEALKRLAEEAATALAPRFADDNVPDVRHRPITVQAVDGAPGDGRAALRGALNDALARRGFAMAPDIADNGIVISGQVSIAPGGHEGDIVRILWTAFAPDGATLGTVEQNNRVPAGSLSGAWGVTAWNVAEAAAPAIVQLISQAAAAK
ncbi:MAG: hypothetical protein RL477_71 [Pseudomonadota bacterium]